MSFKIAVISLIFGHLINTTTFLITLLMLTIYVNPELPDGRSFKDYLLTNFGYLLSKLKENYHKLKIPEKKND